MLIYQFLAMNDYEKLNYVKEKVSLIRSVILSTLDG